MTDTKGAVSLKAMAESKDYAVQKTTYFQVDPRLITIEEGFNARPIDTDHVFSIKTAYKNGATLPPLSVRVDAGVIILVDGHHRHAALMELISEGEEVLRIDCSQFRGNDADRVALMLTTAQGKPLTPLQMGVQYKKLHGFGWSVKEICEKTGKSSVHVSEMLDLANANSDVRALVASKSVAAGVAVRAVRKHGDGAGKALSGQLEAAKAQGKKKITAKTVARHEGITKAGIVGLVMKAYGLNVGEAEQQIMEVFAK